MAPASRSRNQKIARLHSHRKSIREWLVKLAETLTHQTMKFHYEFGKKVDKTNKRIKMKTIADLFLLNEIILSKLLFSTCISTIFLLRCQFHLQLTNPKTFLKHNTILQTNYYLKCELSLLHKALATDHRCTSALHANWSMGLFDLTPLKAQ